MNKLLCTHLNVRDLYGSLFSCLIAVFLFASRQSYKEVPYLQDAGVIKDTNQQENSYDARTMPKDLLIIVVSCTSPELTVPFNLTVTTPANAATVSTQLITQPVLQPYLVDDEGKINFPVLGELRVGGLTKREAKQLIIDKLKPYIKETPVVTVRMVDYKISVLGEVTCPGIFTVNSERINLLEALAMADDMTVWGARDNVRLIREGVDGKQEVVTLDLNKAETILSSYYWLWQSDIVYVIPNKAETRNPDIGDSTSLWFSVTPILVSLVSSLVTISKQ